MNCGTTLTDVEAASNKSGGQRDQLYDFRYGETDLMESTLRRKATTLMTVFVGVLIVIMAGGLIFAFIPSLVNEFSEMPLPGLGAADEERSPTPRPSLAFSTVTPAPPTNTATITPTATNTATATSTPEPCIQRVETGDNLYALAARCGHTSFDVLQLIVDENDLPDANSITAGQEIIIPWPTEIATETLPPQEDASANNTSADSAAVALNVSTTDEANATSDIFDEDFDPFFVPTATLRPDVQFHTVASGDTMIAIAQLYNANAEILSQLNPEIQFGGCDFGERFGGERCVVNLSPGQLVRVPAPTPTPTLSPTPSGSETPTPTATATFNAPRLQTPRDRSFFRRNELITLRWVPSGTLGSNQTYRVNVQDTTAGIAYLADTTETSYVLPAEWQSKTEERHEYAWHITIIDRDNPGNPSYTTDTLTFIWEGRGEDTE